MDKTCFVVCAIGDEGTDVRTRSDQLYKHILEPICAACDFKAIRSDQINNADSITQTIIDYLNNAELVIADITGHNPNVFYEMGYRSSNGKPIIHMRQKNETLPFDIAGIRAFDYDLHDLDAVEETKRRLKQAIEGFDFDNIDITDKDDKALNSTINIAPLNAAIYEIHDKIDDLKNEIKKKDTEMIQAIVTASTTSNPQIESQETVIMKMMMPEILRNPEMLDRLMELGKKADKNKK